MDAERTRLNPGDAKMADDLPITDLLRKVQSGDEDAFTTLTEYFCELARQIAQEKLAKYPQQVREDAQSIIGLEALRSVLSYIGQIKKEIANQSQFLTLLRAVIRNKIADVARRLSEEISRGVELGKHDPVGRGSTPLEGLIEKETEIRLRSLAVRVTELIYQSDDQIELTIADLGVLQFYSAEQIRAELAVRFPNVGLPSKSAVLIRLRRIRKRLARELGAEFDDE
jgi:hypothetical protein